ALRSRRRERSDDAERIDSNPGGDPGPLDAMLAREREQRVRAALEAPPAAPRGPLGLFYRQEQSIKQVATRLGPREEAGRQRLSRGRSSLKQGVAELVEETLEGGRTGKAFAAAVVAALAVAAGGSGAAAAPGRAAARPGWRLAAASVGALTVALAIVLGV